MLNHWPRQGELFPRIPEPSQDQIKGLLESFHAELRQVIRVPFDDFQHRRTTDEAFRRRTGKHLAWWLNGEMTHYAETHFVDHALKPMWLSNGMFALRLASDLLITIKRLRRRRAGGRELFRSNYLTDTTKNYHDQRKVIFFPDLARIVLGWLTTREDTEVETYIAYPRTERLGFRWNYEITDLAGGAFGLAAPGPDGPDVDQIPPGFTLTPKKDAGKRGDK